MTIGVLSSARPGVVAALFWLVAACDAGDPLAEVIQLQEADRYLETIEPLSELVAENPDDPELNYRLGLALLADQQYGMAVWPLRRAADSPTHSVKAGLELAWAAHRNGTQDDAVAAATQVLKKDPENVSALLVRGRAHLHANHEERALEDFERIEAIDPDDASPWMSRALALAKLGRVEEASAQIEAIRVRVDAEVEAAEPLMCALVAVFKNESGDAEGAERAHEACLERFPDAAVVRQRAVEFYDDTQRSEQGTAILREVLTRTPARTDIRDAIATRLRLLGQHAEAEKVLREGIEHDPGPGPWVSLAFHHEALRDPAKAKQALSTALALMPQAPPDLRLAYADMASRAGDHEEALAQIPLLPWPGFAPMIRGRVAFERGEFADALREFESAIERQPDNAGLRQLAGQAAEQVGNFDRAIEEYGEAVRTQQPGHDAGLELARLHEALGNPRAALTAAQLHQRANPADLVGVERVARLAIELRMGELARQQLERLSARAGAGAAFAIHARLATDPGDLSQALAKMQRAGFDLSAPRNRAALRAYVDLLVRSELLDDAQRVARDAVKARDGDAGLVAIHAQTLEGTDADAARSLYHRAIAIVPEQLDALVGLGRLAELDGDPSAAVELYDRALTARHDEADAGWRAIRIAEERSAAPELQRRLLARLRADPRDGLAAVALARLLLEVNPERSLELARRAARLGVGSEAEAAIAAAESALQVAGGPSS